MGPTNEEKTKFGFLGFFYTYRQNVKMHETL